MQIINEDCLKILPQLPENSIDSIITDPPYGLSFMGKNWDYGVPGSIFWKEILRVAKPGAILLAFGGTRTHHRLMSAIEDAGWEIRDCLMWLYGTGFPKSLDISKSIDKSKKATREVVGRRVHPTLKNPANVKSRAFHVESLDSDTSAEQWDITAPSTDLAKLWNGWGTALKPAWEPIILAMKPFEGTYIENIEKHNVAGINIDACRLDKGRWPTNLILDEESAELLDEQTGVLKSGTGAVKKSTSVGYRPNAYGTESRPVGTPNIEYGDSGGASRFFYCAKAAKSEKGKENNHPTVKPLKLMEYLCNLVKMPNKSVVLDPFMGSGTTGVAAQNLGLDFIGIEMEKEYFEIAKKRLGIDDTNTRDGSHFE